MQVKLRVAAYNQTIEKGELVNWISLILLPVLLTYFKRTVSTRFLNGTSSSLELVWIP